MAWQLIYTSAPRSLEAGRSGFGTVARHRTISPLLVSAIERTSQFSRLPGVDTGRVIFCYRIVAVAGGRFHVLSSIRDAGADYTGRTNHIAHHLIADPREVAQLGANGPSPADVLLAMQWATSWTEQPRFFEATEEVALATIRPANSSAWLRITGSPEQAWLLASGDASRGAYVIQPAGTDLRAVFAESLRLIPERLWQISFTTSLQPSDEPADFRWIGIEERSPLRAQTESSGRPTLNLAAPDTLPLVEMVQPAAANLVRQDFAQTSVASLAEGRTDSPKTTRPVASGRPNTTRQERAVENPIASPTFAPRGGQRWMLFAGAAVAVAVVAFVVGRPIYVGYEHRKSVREDIGSILTEADFFSTDVAEKLKAANEIDLAKEIAKVGKTLVRVAKSADFDAMKVRLPDDELRQRAQKVNLALPKEIADFDERLKQIAALHQVLIEFQPQSEGYQAFEELEKRRIEAVQLTSAATKSETFSKIRREIVQRVDQRRAQALRTLLTGANDGRVQPAQPITWFERVLADSRPASEDDETKLILKAAQQLIDDWKFVESAEPNKVITALEERLDQRPDWPIWLKGKAKSKTTVAPIGKTPAPMPPTAELTPTKPPLYFVRAADVKAGMVVPILQLDPSVIFTLAASPAEAEKPYPSYAGSPTNFGPYGDGFALAEGTLTFGKQPPTGEFILKARDKQGKPTLFVIWAISEEKSFAGLNLSISREEDFLVVTGLMKLPGDSTPKMRIQLPSEFGKSGEAPPKFPLAGDRLNIHSFVERLNEEIIDLKGKLEKPASQGPDALAHLGSFESEIKPHLSEQAGKKITEAIPAKRAGQYLEAIGTEWPDWISTKVTIKADSLFKPGNELAKADNDKLQSALENAITSVKSAIADFNAASGRAAKEKKGSSDDTAKKNVPVIRILNAMKQMLETIASNGPEQRKKREEMIAAQRLADEKSLEGLKKHPLLNGKLPTGSYRIFGVTATDQSELFLVDLNSK